MKNHVNCKHVLILFTCPCMLRNIASVFRLFDGWEMFVLTCLCCDAILQITRIFFYVVLLHSPSPTPIKNSEHWILIFVTCLIGMKNHVNCRHVLCLFTCPFMLRKSDNAWSDFIKTNNQFHIKTLRKLHNILIKIAHCVICCHSILHLYLGCLLVEKCLFYHAYVVMLFRSRTSLLY